MHRARLIRALTGLAVIVPSIAILGFAARASAAAGSAVTCSKLVGNGNTDTGTVTGCSAGATGGSGTLAHFLPSGGKVKWADGTTTKYTTTEGPPNTNFPCPGTTSQFNLKGAVTASTNSSIAVGAKVKMVVCVNETTLVIKSAPGSVVQF